ncbi:hypothetical protein D1872_253180 [compost metagenome]
MHSRYVFGFEDLCRRMKTRSRTCRRLRRQIRLVFRKRSKITLKQGGVSSLFYRQSLAHIFALFLKHREFVRINGDDGSLSGLLLSGRISLVQVTLDQLRQFRFKGIAAQPPPETR